MPSGIYIRTNEVRNHLSECRKREFFEGKRTCWNKGKHPSEETRKKIGEHNFWRGKKHLQLTQLNKSRVFTPELRIEMSKRQQGKNGSNWKGGITPKNVTIRHSIEMRLWREAVFSKDNWTCQKCIKRGTYLHAHHILNYADSPSLRTAIDNGIALCIKCHKLFHTRYGRRNNTREQIAEFNSIS
jgi:5-methylcytosine-specific restriction endonuclease McrA